jgi:hypothetical protein
MKFSIGSKVVLKANTPIRRLNIGEVYNVDNVEERHHFSGGYGSRHNAIKVNGEWYREDYFSALKDIKEMKYNNFMIMNQSGGFVYKDTMSKAKTYVSEQLKLKPLGVFGIYELSLVGKTKEIPVDWENVELTTTDKI